MKIFLENCGSYNKECLILEVDFWDDRGYVTSFDVFYKNNLMNEYIGKVKISKEGFNSFWDNKKIVDEMKKDNIIRDNNEIILGDTYFSLSNEELYQNIWNISRKTATDILNSLKDSIYNFELYKKYKNENSFKWSLSRAYNTNYIEGPLKRLVNGEKKINYDLSLDFNSNILELNIDSYSNPPKNIYAVIGPNASGKTMLLKKITQLILEEKYILTSNEKIVNVTYVSFSPFDDSKLLNDFHTKKYQDNFNYIGLFAKNKKNNFKKNIKSKKILIKKYNKILLYKYSNNFNVEYNLFNYFSKTIINDISYILKNRVQSDIELLKTMIENISYDNNIKELGIINLIEEYEEIINKNDNRLKIRRRDLLNELKSIFNSLSSGYKIVLITLITLIAKVKEQSILLIDEPELFLHPPLVLSFVNEINRILTQKNGFTLMVTHSPVVIQEIPLECVYRINRSNSVVKLLKLNEENIEFETYGGNISEITTGIFGLELQKTGFYKKITDCYYSDGDKDYYKTLNLFDNNIGREGRILIRNLEN